MKKRVLGNSGLEVSAIELGCMGFSQSYPPSIRIIGERYPEEQEKLTKK